MKPEVAPSPPLPSQSPWIIRKDLEKSIADPHQPDAQCKKKKMNNQTRYTN